MILKLDLGPEVEAGLLAQAGAQGLTLEQFVQRELKTLAQGTAAAIPQDEDEWSRSFHEWVHSHSTSTPLLSDEAIGRDSIYRDRGL